MKCVFPGTFNPFTLGHFDIVKKGIDKYGEVIIAVAAETYKNEVLPLPDRLQIAYETVRGNNNVEVIGFDGYLTDLLKRLNIYNVIRGVRDERDLSYERELAKIYTEMDDRVDVSIFYSDYSHISASLVRRIASEGSCLDGLVAPRAISLVKRLYND